MAAITGAWLTPSEVHYLEGAAMVYVLSALVRYAVTYALVARCLRQTRPEDRPAVLRGTAEVLRSLRRSNPPSRCECETRTQDPD
jgi:hypothetical protein